MAELLRHVTTAVNPPLAHLWLIPCVLAIVGATLVCRGYFLSRIASACTLFALGVIAIGFGHTAIPEAFLLVIILGLSASGASPFFHRDTSRVQAGIRASILVIATLAFVGLYIYAIEVIGRITAT